VAGELFKYMTDTDIVHVPYKGGAMAINDLVAGHVHVIWESLNSIAPHTRSRKIRALPESGAPVFKERFALIGDEPAGGAPQDFADTIRSDSARWAVVIRRSGARID
jgi:tripartite-type tricarboxylate transporter receptor subunit TctC